MLRRLEAQLQVFEKRERERETNQSCFIDAHTREERREKRGEGERGEGEREREERRDAVRCCVPLL